MQASLTSSAIEPVARSCAMNTHPTTSPALHRRRAFGEPSTGSEPSPSPTRDRAIRLSSSDSSDRRVTALRDSIAALGWPLLALIPLIAGGVWLAMRLALRPLEALRLDIAQRDSRNLEPLRSDGHPVELAPIADAVAALLERLKLDLDAERAFAARSAHELRTPIAGALAQTQQLADELEGTPGVRRVREIEAALKRLSTMSEKLLQMARIEAGFAKLDREIDLLPALNMVIGDINASSIWARTGPSSTQKQQTSWRQSARTPLRSPFAILSRIALQHNGPPSACCGGKRRDRACSQRRSRGRWRSNWPAWGSPSCAELPRRTAAVWASPSPVQFSSRLAALWCLTSRLRRH